MLPTVKSALDSLKSHYRMIAIDNYSLDVTYQVLGE
jgi:hypothetical protein